MSRSLALLVLAACAPEYAFLDLPELCPAPDGFGVGYSFASAGDVDGDGFDDVVVGSHGHQGDPGVVCVFRGGERGVETMPYAVVTGADGDRIGAHVDGLGDVNGDGFDDIGYTTWASLDETSEVRVHLGGPELSEEPIWTGEQGPFHEKVHGVGDVDGDGYDDVLLTARPNARLHRGGPDGLQEASWAFGPEGYGGELATSGGRAGDLNGDGLMDVVLGDAWARAPGSDVLDGAVYVWLGRPQGLAATPDITLFGDDQSLGHTLAAGGDLDGDGYDDLLVTDNMDGRGDDLYVYSGGPEGLHPDRRWGVALPLGVEVEGRPVAVGVGDTDGDGRGEVLMNVERDGDGVVELWTRATSGLTGPVWTHRWIGRHRILVAPGGDLDGDGLQDVLYGEDDAVFGADLFALTGPFQEPLEDHDPYASLH